MVFLTRIQLDLNRTTCLPKRIEPEEEYVPPVLVAEQFELIVVIPLNQLGRIRRLVTTSHSPAVLSTVFCFTFRGSEFLTIVPAISVSVPTIDGMNVHHGYVVGVSL